MPKYWFYFASQTLGTAIFLWKGIPFYRKFLAGQQAPADVQIWTFIVLGLIQTAFWLSRRMEPFGGRIMKRPVLGTVVLFLGRLVFVFVGGFFSAFFYIRGVADVHPSRVFLLLALLFSVFCYTLQMEKVGKGLLQED